MPHGRCKAGNYLANVLVPSLGVFVLVACGYAAEAPAQSYEQKATPQQTAQAVHSQAPLKQKQASAPSTDGAASVPSASRQSKASEPHVSASGIPQPSAASSIRSPALQAEGYGDKISDRLAPWALALSIASILLTLSNFIYGLRKDKRARRASIVDDFWFRKVVAPLSIEPLVEGVLDLLKDLPSVDQEDEIKKAWAQRVTQVFIASSAHTSLLSFLDPALPAAVAEKLTACEDCLTDYAGKLSTGEGPDPEATRQVAWSRLTEALELVRAKHLENHQ